MQEIPFTAPLATGTPFQPSYGFDNMPFMGNQNPLVQMIGQNVLSSVMGSQGMSPMGFHDQNMYDQMRRMRLTRMQQEMMSNAAQAERNNYMRTARGIARMTGTPWDQETIEAANVAANAMVAAAPMMAMIDPGALDAMNGIRGSSVVMSAQMFDANRYRMDPVTGQVGMSIESQKIQQQELYRQLYETGNVGRLQGLTAGQAGELYRDMTLRGMIGDEMTRTERGRASLRRMQGSEGLRMAMMEAGVSEVADVDNLSFEDVTKLMETGGVQDEMRSYDTGRIKSTIESYAGAVSAVRDIFGDAGRPNAPMAELMQMLDDLSNNSMAQIAPGKLQDMVRMTQNLTNMTGVSMQNALMLQQHASNVGAQMGLEPVFGVGAMQGGLAFRQAYSSMGMGRHTAWGAYSTDQVMQMDINLRQGANASRAANRFGAALSLARTGAVAEGTDFALYTDALRNMKETGATTWTDSNGVERDLMMNENEISALVTSSGLDADQYTRLLANRWSNRREIQDAEIGNVLVRRQQGQEVRREMASQVRGMIAIELQSARGGNMSARDASALAGTVSSDLMNDVMALSREDFTNDEERRKAMVNSLRSGLGNRVSDDDLGVLADAIYGRANFRGQNMQQVHQAFNDRVLSEIPGINNQARSRQALQTALAPLRRSGPLQAVMEELMRPREAGEEDPNVSRLIATAFGGKENDQIRAALVPAIENITRQRGVIDGLEARRDGIDAELANIRQTNDQPLTSRRYRDLMSQRRSLNGEIETEYGRLQNFSGALNDVINDQGIFEDDGTGDSDPNVTGSGSTDPQSSTTVSNATLAQLTEALQGGSSGPTKIVGTVTIKDDRTAEIDFEAPDTGSEDEVIET